MSDAAPIAIVLRHLVGGGIERVALSLAGSLADRGHKIDIVLLSAHGDYRDESFSRFSFYYFSLRPGSLSLLNYFRRHNVRARMLLADPLSQIAAGAALKRRWPKLGFTRGRNRARRGFAIRQYILKRNPKAMLARGLTASLAAVDGRYLSKTSPSPPIAASMHNDVENAKTWQPEMRDILPEAEAVVCVSRGVAESVDRICETDDGRISVIYNPIDPDIPRLREAPVAHPWLESDTVPVILMVARIAPQKDFPTLLSAFALVCEKRDARLLIVSPQGSSKKADPLIAQAVKLGVREKVDILGFDQNPYRYMHKASCFVLSTFTEGLGNVLIEALACGTPVVSTDVPYGPSEILEDGKWGKLVPIQDAPALARAIEETLDGDRPDASELEKRSRFFSADRATDRYEALIHKLVSEHSPDRPA